jgi:hypothetical protein
MLFLLFGSSAAGKTFALDALRSRVADLAIHEFDEIGVPPGADTAWRHRADERWVRRALDYQGEGTDLLVAGRLRSASCSRPRLRRSWRRSRPA